MRQHVFSNSGRRFRSKVTTPTPVWFGLSSSQYTISFAAISTPIHKKVTLAYPIQADAAKIAYCGKSPLDVLF